MPPKRGSLHAVGVRLRAPKEHAARWPSELAVATVPLVHRDHHLADDAVGRIEQQLVALEGPLLDAAPHAKEETWGTFVEPPSHTSLCL